MLKNAKLSNLIVEDVRLTKLEEDGSVVILNANNSAEQDKAKEKIILKLAIMEQMFAAGSLTIVEKPKGIGWFDPSGGQVGGTNIGETYTVQGGE